MAKQKYTSRKIDGERVAQVLSKNLKKRMTPGPGSRAASRDPFLEIDVADKNLTDQDFAQFIDDLLQCIKYRDNEHTGGLAKVTELHIEGNKLTIESLPKLGEMVELSAGDLKDLDLSNNNIEVGDNKRDKEIWLKFLDSFKNCYMLKRLGLGNNPLGPVGMETLARVYLKSDVDFLEEDAEAVIESVSFPQALAEQSESLKVPTGKENEQSTRGIRQKKSPNKGKAIRQTSGHSTPAPTKNTSQADLKRFTCTRGLRSIPYLIITNVSMKKSGAVHLASMLSMQRTPDQLLEYLPSGKILSLPETNHCKSIIWLPNNDLPPYVTEFLEKSPVIDDRKFQIESDDEAVNDDSSVVELATTETIYKSDNTAQRRLQKKNSIAYARLTKRVRMESLREDGWHSSDIWMAALKMMNISRVLLVEGENSSIETTDKEQGESGQRGREKGDGSISQHIEYITRRIREWEALEHTNPDSFVIPRNEPAPMYPFQRGTNSYETNFPSLQSISASNSLDVLEFKPEKRLTPTPVKDQSSRFPSPQQAYPITRSGKGNNPRTNSGLRASRKGKEAWRFNLPFDIWRGIIAHAAEAEGILDLEQQNQLIRYATDSKSLDDEMEIRGHVAHQQIWRILDKNNCFTYSPL
ncbi:hypothetical protein BDV25DRAFT_141964 [Aspergillus avenaceus]|uniref:Leucine rich repeat protein n=1 Tax=Aspergillus avenaceus TaxID=36643 RepID=A0A5N6TQ40_ASPAV|nr:hypothetical protein BDV25DRAFT_141964 [Aspergillus avenaceus]